MSFNTTTPWRNASELAMVRDMIYPHHIAVDLYALNAERPDRRAQAVNEIMWWTVKAYLPHPITATAELLAAQLFDEDMQSRVLPSKCADGSNVITVFPNNFAIKSTYATSFCRFVNGFVDKDVTGVSESSMFSNAAKIGLPVSFVELRHRATHGRELPAYSDLKHMNQEALEWLYTTWWKVNAVADPGRALWEAEEYRQELKEARIYRENLAERRALLEKLEAEVDAGRTDVERPVRHVCGSAKGLCQESFLLKEDLRRHRKVAHQGITEE